MISSHVTVQLHGFTGSGKVFKRNVAGLSLNYHVLVPDLRGHGDSDKPRSGYHVSRLAMDLANFIEHMHLSEYGDGKQIAAIGTSLGAAILWYVPSFVSLSNSMRTSDNSVQELRRTIYYAAILTHDIRRPSTTSKLSLRLGSRARKPWPQQLSGTRRTPTNSGHRSSIRPPWHHCCMSWVQVCSCIWRPFV